MSLLAVDIGSSTCKAVVFRTDGQMLSDHSTSYAPDLGRPSFAEMDPGRFWNAVCLACRSAAGAVKDPVRAIALSSHGETFVALDSCGQPLNDAILNQDIRAIRESAACEQTIGRERLFQITGLVAHPMYPIPKILWLRKHEPEIFRRTKSFVTLIGYLLDRMGLPAYVDYSLASRFLAFDIRKRMWSDEILSAPESNVVNERSIRLYLGLKKVVEKEKFDFYTIQSFPGLGDDYSATCFAQSMMLEDGFGTSTLGDFNTLLTVWLLTKLSKERVYYGDLQHIDKQKKEIKIIGDGACPPSLAGKLGPAGFSEHGIPTEGEAGGLSIKLICKVGEGVLARLGRVNGEFQMVITRAAIFEPPKDQVRDRLSECGIPFWPHGFVRAHSDIDKMLDSWTNEYACLGYGSELYPALTDFCELTGIEPVLV